MTWEDYVEALTALASVDAKATAAARRHQDRRSEQRRRLADDGRAAQAETATLEERLTAAERELSSVVLDGHQSSDVPPPVSLDEVDRRLRRVEVGTAEDLALMASLQRSLSRMQADVAPPLPPVVEPVPFVPPPQVRRRWLPPALAVLIIVIVLVVVLIV